VYTNLLPPDAAYQSKTDWDQREPFDVINYSSVVVCTGVGTRVTHLRTSFLLLLCITPYTCYKVENIAPQIAAHGVENTCACVCVYARASLNGFSAHDFHDRWQSFSRRVRVYYCTSPESSNGTLHTSVEMFKSESLTTSSFE